MSETALSRTKLRLYEAAVQVQDAPFATKVTFTPRELVQATLPHKNPGDIPVWQRRNGNYALVIQPGYDAFENKIIGYPYGSIPRLLIFWLTTQVLQTGERRIEIGDSLADFMRQLGLNPKTGGGKRSDAARLKEQMTRLFSAKISFQYKNQATGPGSLSRLDMQVAPKANIWWTQEDPAQPTLFNNWIELGEEFFNAITERPIPVDLRALQAIKNSPLALDLYAWLTLTTFQAARKGKARSVSWKLLMQQMGSHYSDVKDFKKAIKKTLPKIQLVYPNLKLESINGGIRVLPSLPAVLPKENGL